VIGLAAFDYDFEALDNPDNEKVKMYSNVIKGTQDPVYFFFPILEKYFLWALPERKALHQKMDEMNAIFFSIINRKRKALASNENKIEEGEKDLLTLMLEANQDTENPQHQLSDVELRDNLAAFFAAGYVSVIKTFFHRRCDGSCVQCKLT
jgi:cytochrome P450